MWTTVQADDVAQETFLRTWTHIERFDPAKAQFATWLFTIARNQAINELNRAGPARLWQSTEVLLEHESLEPQPDKVLEQVQANAQLHAAIRRLPVATLPYPPVITICWAIVAAPAKTRAITAYLFASGKRGACRTLPGR